MRKIFVDIGQSCKDAYFTLRKKPSLAVPLFVFALVAAALVTLFVSFSPIVESMRAERAASDEYDAIHPIETTGNFFERTLAQSLHEQERQAYLSTIDVSPLWSEAQAITFVLWLGGGIVLLVLLWLYMMTATFVAIKDTFTGHPLDWPGVLGETTRRFIPALFGWIIVPLLIMVLPIAGIIMIIVFAMSVHPILGMLVLFLGIIGIGAWAVYAMVKITLVSGTFFLESKGILSATKTSWHKARGKFWRVGLLLVVFSALSWIPTQLTGSAYGEAISYYWYEGDGYLAWVIVIGLINAVVYGIGNAYASLVFCHAYKDLDADRKKTF